MKGELGPRAKEYHGVTPPSYDEQADVLIKVIDSLRPLDNEARTRLLQAAAIFYGIGR